MDKIEIGPYYIVTKGNKYLKTGDAVSVKIKFKKNHLDMVVNEFIVSTPPRNSGLNLSNYEVFNTKKELKQFFEGVEVEYNLEYVNSKIKHKYLEIEKLKFEHGIE